MKKVVLAYSGGLDTSCIIPWLKDKGYETIAFIADVGQGDNFGQIKKRALKTGASKVYCLNLQRELIKDYAFPALKAGAVYENKYYLACALSRPLIAKHQVFIAKTEKADAIVHGCTGKGNDQVRFELSYYALNPKINVIAPWKDKKFLDTFKGRTDLINYAKKWNIDVKASRKKPYSEDENLMHISHEAGILEDPSYKPNESIFSMTTSPKKAPNKETIIEIYFVNGIPVQVKNLTSKTKKTGPLKLFLYLNELGSKNGIGREDQREKKADAGRYFFRRHRHSAATSHTSAQLTGVCEYPVVAPLTSP